MSPEQSFAGKVAFITGAAGGIGRATALAFAGRGAAVALADLSEGVGHSWQKCPKFAQGGWNGLLPPKETPKPWDRRVVPFDA